MHSACKKHFKAIFSITNHNYIFIYEILIYYRIVNMRVYFDIFLILKWKLSQTYRKYY